MDAFRYGGGGRSSEHESNLTETEVDETTSRSAKRARYEQTPVMQQSFIMGVQWHAKSGVDFLQEYSTFGEMMGSGSYGSVFKVLRKKKSRLRGIEILFSIYSQLYDCW